jgi:hypothetical protein
MNQFNMLKTDFCLSYMKNFRPYLAENTVYVHYKNHSINDVQGNCRYLFWDSHETHKHIVWAKFSFLMLQQMVRIITTGL